MSAGSAGPGCCNLAQAPPSQAPPRQAPPRQAPPTQASRPGRPSKLLSDPAAWFRLISACLAEGSILAAAQRPVGGVMSSLDSIRPPYVDLPPPPELLSTPGPSGSSWALEDPSSCCCHCCCCAPCWRRGFTQLPGGSCEQAERPGPGPGPCLVLMMKAVCIFTPELEAL